MNEELREKFPVDKKTVELFLRGHLTAHLRTLSIPKAYKYLEALRHAAYKFREDSDDLQFGEPINPNVKMYIYELPGEEDNPLFFRIFRYLHLLGHDLKGIYDVLRQVQMQENAPQIKNIRKFVSDQLADSYKMAQERLLRPN